MTFSCSPTTFELLGVNLLAYRSNVIVIVIYRTGPIQELFYTELITVLESLALYNCQVVITDDFNIHVDDVDDDNGIRFNSLIESLSLKQLVQGPTHIGGHTLDLVITRANNILPTVIAVDLPQISDHSVIFVDIQIHRPPVQTIIDVNTRAWKNFDADKFRSDLLISPICRPMDELKQYNTIQYSNHLVKRSLIQCSN